MGTQKTKNIEVRFTNENIIIFFIALAGVIFRIRQYLTGRSLWVDEAMLALNIVNRNFLDLFKPLDYDQGAPIGFLLVEKLFNLLFGRNELVLRFFPLILGLLSLWIFYLLLKRFTHGTSLAIAFALFALNPRLIYYSSEVKQYIGDVFVTIVLLLIASHVFEKSSGKRLGILTISGVIALWFSHPSLFVLAGIGVSLFISYIQKRDFKSIRPIIGMGILWLANIFILYSLTLGQLKSNSFMMNYWQDAFAPMPPWSDLKWFWGAFTANADVHFAITIAPWILFVLILAGLVELFIQKKQIAASIIWIMFFTLLASSLKLYPSLERMVLFLTPIGILLIGLSLDFFAQKLRHRSNFSALTILIISVYLFWGMIPNTVDQFISPKYFEHIRPAMDYLQGTWKDSDAMYISNGGVPAFEYYAPMYGLENADFISGQPDDYNNPDTILERLETLKGNQRVWVLMSHVYERGNLNEHDLLFEYLKRNGVKKRVFIDPGTSVYLYLFDLSQ